MGSESEKKCAKKKQADRGKRPASRKRVPLRKKAVEKRATAEKAPASAEARRPPAAKARAPRAGSPAPKLLSGGNPQIPKGDGDAVVQAYIAAMPGWKSRVGRLFDALIVATVPEVAKAVRWNMPFYGAPGEGWHLGFRCFTKYVQISFLTGAALRPPPPLASKHPRVRYLNLYESEPLDEERLASWIAQAFQQPGDPLF